MAGVEWPQLQYEWFVLNGEHRLSMRNSDPVPGSWLEVHGKGTTFDLAAQMLLVVVNGGPS